MLTAPPVVEPGVVAAAEARVKAAEVTAAPTVREPRYGASAFSQASAFALEFNETNGPTFDASGAKEVPIGRDKPSERDESQASRWDYSFDVAVVSDYRRGGVSRSDHDPAVQVAFDVEAPSGWSAGVFVSNIAERKGANTEINLYGAKSFELGDAELSLGAMAVVLPGGDHTDFGVAQASLSIPIGPIDATLAVNYAWEQPNLDDEDNIYVALRGRTPIGRFAGVPLTLGASVGHADGHLAIEGTKTDWSLSLTADFHGLDVGISYVDTDLEDERGDPGCVISIAHTF